MPPNSARPPVEVAAAPAPSRQPLQVLHISKREEQQQLERQAAAARAEAEAASQRANELENAARVARGEAPCRPHSRRLHPRGWGLQVMRPCLIWVPSRG
ncbi:hypothetical protein [Cyanobium sp. ATX-6F1]|uniref:hypothetical protein n=1 Tax=Cyanobium sp. ATX-6F1 TaxID=3137388 RepID=UPI0039BE7E35